MTFEIISFVIFFAASPVVIGRALFGKGGSSKAKMAEAIKSL